MKLSRRSFLATVPVAAFAQTKPLPIQAVEVWQLRGHADTVRGIDRQPQVNPLDIYDELRPKPYRDAAAGTPGPSPQTALYLKIRTSDGEGLYGPIDREVAIVVQEQLRPFLIGKDALA